MKNTMLGKQYPDSTVADRLGTTSVGWKEETGFTENNDKYTWHRDNPARFITDYSARYLLFIFLFIRKNQNRSYTCLLYSPI